MADDPSNEAGPAPKVRKTTPRPANTLYRYASMTYRGRQELGLGFSDMHEAVHCLNHAPPEALKHMWGVLTKGFNSGRGGVTQQTLYQVQIETGGRPPVLAWMSKKAGAKNSQVVVPIGTPLCDWIDKWKGRHLKQWQEWKDSLPAEVVTSYNKDKPYKAWPQPPPFVVASESSGPKVSTSLLAYMCNVENWTDGKPPILYDEFEHSHFAAGYDWPKLGIPPAVKGSEHLNNWSPGYQVEFGDQETTEVNQSRQACNAQALYWFAHFPSEEGYNGRARMLRLDEKWGQEKAYKGPTLCPHGGMLGRPCYGPHPSERGSVEEAAVQDIKGNSGRSRGMRQRLNSVNLQGLVKGYAIWDPPTDEP